MLLEHFRIKDKILPKRAEKLYVNKFNAKKK